MLGVDFSGVPSSAERTLADNLATFDALHQQLAEERNAARFVKRAHTR